MSEDIGLRRETSGALLRITIDRPARANAIDRAMLRTLGEWLLEAMRDDDLRALVLTGAGDRVFSAGADLAEIPEQTESARAAREFDDAWEALARRVERLPILTVAAINGACVGSGLTLAMACDLRVAVPDAYLCYPALANHLLPSATDIERLRALVGPARCKALLMTGLRLDAASAQSMGLVDRVVAADGLAACVDDLCSTALAAEAREVTALKRLCVAHADYMVVDLCYRAVYDREKAAHRRLRED